MTPELAAATLQFMSRVQLNAQEIEAFQTCCNALHAEAQPSEVTKQVNEDEQHPKQHAH